jgi:hypothetical protein
MDSTIHKPAVGKVRCKGEAVKNPGLTLFTDPCWYVCGQDAERMKRAIHGSTMYRLKTGRVEVAVKHGCEGRADQVCRKV